MRLHSRSPIERMAYIARLLREGQQFTTGMVAAEFEVSYKTIDRDLQFMRDRLGFILEFRNTGPQESRTWVGRGPMRVVL